MLKSPSSTPNLGIINSRKCLLSFLAWLPSADRGVVPWMGFNELKMGEARLLVALSGRREICKGGWDGEE